MKPCINNYIHVACYASMLRMHAFASGPPTCKRSLQVKP